MSERFRVSTDSPARRKIEGAELQMGPLSRKREPRNPVRRRDRQDDRSAFEARNSHRNPPRHDRAVGTRTQGFRFEMRSALWISLHTLPSSRRTKAEV